MAFVTDCDKTRFIMQRPPEPEEKRAATLTGAEYHPNLIVSLQKQAHGYRHFHQHFSACIQQQHQLEQESLGDGNKTTDGFRVGDRVQERLSRRIRWTTSEATSCRTGMSRRCQEDVRCTARPGHLVEMSPVVAKFSMPEVSCGNITTNKP